MQVPQLPKAEMVPAKGSDGLSKAGKVTAGLAERTGRSSEVYMADVTLQAVCVLDVPCVTTGQSLPYTTLPRSLSVQNNHCT